MMRRSQVNSRRPRDGDVAGRASRIVVVAVLVAASVLSSLYLDRSGHAADTPDADYSKELPRTPSTPPAQAVGTLQLAPGIAATLVAAEPLVASPVAVCWDEAGRMFVVEMRGYSEHAAEKLGRIRVLTDDDGDGRYDRAEVYVDGLAWPTAIVPWKGGVFVGDAPNLWYFRDVDGDMRADEREHVFSGFGTSNVQGLFNSFVLRPDGRIHGSGSSAGGDVVRPDRPNDRPVSLRGRDFSFHPVDRDIRPEAGGAQHGLTFDHIGRKYVCSNSDHLQQIVYDERYASNPHGIDAPPTRVSIAADGPQANVFRASPVEPWRLVRTRLRVNGVTPGLVEGGGQAAGYFTSATGVTMLGGSCWPDDWQGLAIVGDVGGNLVHRKRIDDGGMVSIGRRIDENTEWLRSTDNWFRPVQFANGPDGALYVVDFYREVIEHPQSLPPAIKKHLDLNNGRDQGRIYRVAPRSSSSAEPRNLTGLAPAALVDLLTHSNVWHRETACRLLLERRWEGAPAAVRSRLKLAEAATSASTKNALAGSALMLELLATIDRVSLDDLHPWLQHSDARLRETAIRLCEKRLGDVAARRSLAALLNDDHPRVRFQAALSLGESPVAAMELQQAMCDALMRGRGDRWCEFAVLRALRLERGSAFQELLRRGDRASVEAAVVVARTLSPEERRRVAQDVTKWTFSRPLDDSLLPLRLVMTLGTTADLTPEASASLAPWRDRAMEISLDRSHPAAQRIAAIECWPACDSGAVRDAARRVLGQGDDLGIEAAVVLALGKMPSLDVVELLTSAWPRLGPRTRNLAADWLASHPVRLGRWLSLMESGEFRPGDMPAVQRAAVLAHRDASVRQRAVALWPAVATSKQEVLAKYQPSLSLTGEPARGAALFQKHCAGCHRLNDAGHTVGPSLAAFRIRGAEAFLTNLLDPNREVNPQFTNYVATLNSGRTASGILTAETSNGFTLLRAEGQSDTLQREEIDELRDTNKSLMPEGFENQLDAQAIADLIAYWLK